jgi:predicted metal-dependent enzyme (double-stranded beta helix superfamily)
MVAHIAAYDGAEKSILFRRAEGGLKHEETKLARAGEIISLEEDSIHAVTAEGMRPSLAIHVYMGPLMAERVEEVGLWSICFVRI